MRKRLWALSLMLALLFTAAPAAMAAGGSLGNFKASGTYTQGQFTDVASGDWFAGNVETAFELGLMKGSSATAFSPGGNVTVAEAVAMAARLHSIYTTGTESFEQKSPWYQTYVDYAVENGIISEGQFSDYTGAATRLQFAAVFAAALPDEALAEKNELESGAIPDTNSTAVYKLYRAGILTGSDTSGAFRPESTITRAEASAIVARMADESLRKELKLDAAEKTELNSEQVYTQCAPAVFYIEVFNESGSAYASGSGFFISADGIAVTNYHVIKYASAAKATVSGTEEPYEVLGVYAFSEEEDWAVIKVAGSGFPYLHMGGASTVVGGAPAYAIGYPLGLKSTISQGLISNSGIYIEGVVYIQTSAAISSGSSGGALLNKYGEVIGITCASFVDGQNLNLAVPVDKVAYYENSGLTPVGSLCGELNVQFYSDFYPAVDFGALYDVPLYDDYKKLTKGYAMYYYNSDDISEDINMEDYFSLLEKYGFEYYDYFIDEDGYMILVYENSEYLLDIYIGGAELDGEECLCIMTSYYEE